MSKLISLSLISLLVAAQAEAGRIQRHQSARIRQGVKSGQLTRSEAKTLRAEHRENRRMAHEARADGTVTPDERAALRESQMEASQNIYNEKHDAETQ